MSSVESVMNHLSDDDRAWWPFLFMRPQARERMTDGRVLAIAGLYGVLVGLLANIAARFTSHGAAMNPAWFPLATTLAFFVVYRFSFALCWNRRAARLAREAPSP